MRRFRLRLGASRIFGATNPFLGSFDEADRALAENLRARGVNVEVTTTIMADPENARRLAKVVTA